MCRDEFGRASELVGLLVEAAYSSKPQRLLTQAKGVINPNVSSDSEKSTLFLGPLLRLGMPCVRRHRPVGLRRAKICQELCPKHRTQNDTSILAHPNQRCGTFVLRGDHSETLNCYSA
jgi:hypothetical protein